MLFSLVSLNMLSSSSWRRQWHPTPVLLPGKSHGRRSLVGCSPWCPQRVRHDWATSLSRTGEGKGNPLQCSCLENPRDGRAWWALVYGVAQSRTRLKQLSSSSSSMLVRPYHKNLLILLTIGIWTSSREGRGFPGGSVVKNPPTSAGDMGSIPGDGNGNPLQYSCLENSMDWGAWRATVHRVTKNQTWLSNYYYYYY